jgi:hypothetical protein
MAPRTVGVLALSLSLLLGACTPSPDRLPTPARNFYYVIEDETAQHDYLKLEESERQGFLEQLGLWQKWVELSNEEREAVNAGEIKVGFKEFAAHMAWGRPAQVREMQAGDRVVHYQTFIRCTSGPRIGDYVRSNIDCDGTSSEVEIAVEKGIITELKYLD